MFVVLEIAGLLFVGLVVLLLFRAARARPDEPGLRVAAWIGLAIWVGFGLIWVLDLNTVRENPMGTLTNALIACVILAVVMGYRAVLGHLKDRAGR